MFRRTVKAIGVSLLIVAIVGVYFYKNRRFYFDVFLGGYKMVSKRYLILVSFLSSKRGR